MKKLSFTLLLMLAFTASIFASKIAWVYSTSDDATYITLLEGEGHTVTAVSGYWDNLTDAGKIAELEAYDLVIISRNIGSSGSYGTDAAVKANWQSITTPIINLNAYVARNSRLELFPTDASSTTNSYMTTTDISHAIFDGLILSNDTIADEWGKKMSFNGAEVTQSTDAGNGTVLASTPTGEVAIAYWDANTACYSGAGTQAGKRLFLAMSAADVQSDRWKKVLKNSVVFLTAVSTSVEENTPISTSIFPNPTTSQITVSGVKTLQGAIYSVSGKMVKSLDQSSTTVDVSDLTNGLYFISTQAEGKMQNISFIKQ